MLSSILDIVPPTPPARTGQSRGSASEPGESFASLVDDNEQAEMPQATAPAPTSDASSSASASAKSSDNKSPDNKSADTKLSTKPSPKSPAIPVIDSAAVAADLALDLVPLVPAQGDAANQLSDDNAADPLAAFLDAVAVATSPTDDKPADAETAPTTDDQAGKTVDAPAADAPAPATVVAVVVVPVPTANITTGTGDGVPVDAAVAETAPAQLPLPTGDATAGDTDTAPEQAAPSGDASTDGAAPQSTKPAGDEPPANGLRHNTDGLEPTDPKTNSSAQPGNPVAALARTLGPARSADAQASKTEAAADQQTDADASTTAAPITETHATKPQHKPESTEAPAKADAPTKPANERPTVAAVDPFATRTPAFHVLMQQQDIQHVPGAAPTDSDAIIRNVPVSGIAVEIAGQFRENRTRFDIRLDPPDLGRIDVRLDVDRQGQVTSRLVVEKSETLDLLRRDAPQLERALQDAGLKTGDNGLQFSLRDQSANGRDDDRAQNAAKLTVIDEDIAPLHSQTAAYGRALARGGLDISV